MNMIAKSHLFERRLATYLMRFQLKVYPANSLQEVRYPLIFTKLVPPMENMDSNSTLHKMNIQIVVQTKYSGGQAARQQCESLTGSIQEALECLLNHNNPDTLIEGVWGVGDELEYNDIGPVDDDDGIPIYQSETNIMLIG